MTRSLSSTSLNELLSLLALGVGLVGLLRALQTAGDLRYILECAGAVGGTRST